MRQMTLGSLIRSLRMQNKMTQAQLASLVGVTDKAVSKWERGISYPDITLFPKLADILGVAVNDLFNECVDEGKPSRLLRIFEMSHDIRTPLHIILGCADMAQMHRDDPELLARYLESIRISGEYLLRSVNRVMEVAKEGAEGGRDTKYPANIEELGEYLNARPKAQDPFLEKYDFSGKRILVAEDIRLNREIAAEILKQTGAQVEFAIDGQECLNMVSAAPAGYYDLILMDILMPNMDGVEATRRIRRLEDHRKALVPIIALSANVYEKDQKEALEAGMNGFAEKPIFVEKLFEAMRECL